MARHGFFLVTLLFSVLFGGGIVILYHHATSYQQVAIQEGAGE
jgi:uncharacterized membrane protein YeiB